MCFYLRCITFVYMICMVSMVLLSVTILSHGVVVSSLIPCVVELQEMTDTGNLLTTEMGEHVRGSGAQGIGSELGSCAAVRCRALR